MSVNRALRQRGQGGLRLRAGHVGDGRTVSLAGDERFPFCVDRGRGEKALGDGDVEDPSLRRRNSPSRN
jgi:hypothetical protein